MSDNWAVSTKNFKSKNSLFQFLYIKAIAVEKKLRQGPGKGREYRMTESGGKYKEKNYPLQFIN